MRLLMVGDFAVHTGFARVLESLARPLVSLGWDVAVLALNYKGDPHPLQLRHRVYPAHLGGDLHGVHRLGEVITRERPDVLLMVNDPWVLHDYMLALSGIDNAPPAIGYIPIDGTGLRRSDIAPLNSLAHAVAYTDFGLGELRRAGLAIGASVIPHGVDTDLFRPIPQVEARAAVGLDPETFAVLVLDANQYRKRLDLAFAAFAAFARGKGEHVKLVYHGSLKNSQTVGWDLDHMAADLGIADRLIVTGRDFDATRGAPVDQLPLIYSMCDVKLSTSMGEGWGLTTMEAMACGLPCIVPDYAAYHEWASKAALALPVTSYHRHPRVNTVGGVVAVEDVASALTVLYAQPQLRQAMGAAGRATVAAECYRWSVIAAQFDHVLRTAAYGREVTV